MAKQYRIDLIVNAAAADGAARRSADSLKGVEAAAERGAKAAEKGFQGQMVGLAQLQASHIRFKDAVEAAARKAADTATREGTRAAAAKQRELDRQEREVEKQVERWERAQARQTAATEREGVRQVEAEARKHAKVLTDQDVALKVQNQKIRNANDKRIEEAMRAAGVEYRGFKNGWEGASMLAAGVKSVAAAFTGISSVASVLTFIQDGFDRANRSAVEASKLVTDYREALLELAALKGRLGETGPELKENLAFRAKTLQSKEDAIAFQNQMLGVGQSSVDTKDARGKDVKRLIGQAEFDELARMGGAFQAAEHGPADAHARLVGMLPQLIGRRTTAKEAFGEEQALYKIFQPGGGTFTQLVNQFLKNASLVTGGLMSSRESAGLLSAFSTANPQGAGEQVDQLVRATLGGLGRLRGPKVEGGEKQGIYLKRLGVTNQQTVSQIATRISDDFSKQEAEAAAKGEKFNPVDYLRHHGYGNEEDVRALMQFHGLRKSRTWQDTFEPLMGARGDTGEAEEKIRKFQGGDPVAQKRRADIADALASATVGGGAMEFSESFKRQTFNLLKAQGKVHGESWDKVKEGGWGWDSMDAGATTREAIRQLEAERIRIGLAPKPFGFYAGATEKTRAEAMFQSATEIGQAGGNPMAGFDALQRIAEKQLDATNRMVDLMSRGGAPGVGIPQRPPPPRGAMPAGAARP